MTEFIICLLWTKVYDFDDDIWGHLSGVLVDEPSLVILVDARVSDGDLTDGFWREENGNWKKDLLVKHYNFILLTRMV